MELCERVCSLTSILIEMYMYVHVYVYGCLNILVAVTAILDAAAWCMFCFCGVLLLLVCKLLMLVCMCVAGGLVLCVLWCATASPQFRRILEALWQTSTTSVGSPLARYSDASQLIRRESMWTFTCPMTVSITAKFKAAKIATKWIPTSDGLAGPHVGKTSQSAAQCIPLSTSTNLTGSLSLIDAGT